MCDYPSFLPSFFLSIYLIFFFFPLPICYFMLCLFFLLLLLFLYYFAFWSSFFLPFFTCLYFTFYSHFLLYLLPVLSLSLLNSSLANNIIYSLFFFPSLSRFNFFLVYNSIYYLFFSHFLVFLPSSFLPSGYLYHLHLRPAAFPRACTLCPLASPTRRRCFGAS